MTTTTSAATEEGLSNLLASNNFSVASYLNAALENAEEEELQRRMAELALQLQLQTQACHEDIGRIGAELQAILPRCATDIGRVGVGLEGIRLDASQLLAECAHLQNEEVSSSLETLSTLHALRSNLSHTQDILKAAATWDSTLQSIAPLLAQQNLSEAVSALAQLEAGERALRGMPSGRDVRREALEKIRHQVQVLLQPQLKHALQNMHTRLAPLQQCVSLYASLNKIDVLQHEYVANRPATIHKAWFAYRGGEDALVTWLPTWYDAVLSLLTEERRQSLAVFGPDRAPVMIGKVLGECFRPIIGSFRTRLETLISPNGTSATGTGSLESICDLYEATLQFLSLAYEIVAGGWHDVADATAVRGSAVYGDVAEVFSRIASPFAAYQKSLPELEQVHSNISQMLITKDIQQSVGAIGSPTVAVLQDAAEKLKGLSTYVFPVGDAAMGRLELMTGGYQVRKSLLTIDSILTNHAGELAIAIRTLSATMDACKIADIFDDQHVASSLEILKVAGLYQSSLKQFEAKARERMAVLQQRKVSHDMQEKEVTEKSFLLPDGLSVVEIDSILIKAAFADANDDPDILERLSGAGSVLFPESNKAAERLKRSCQTLVFDVCSAVPRKQLANMSNMPCWTSSINSLDSYGTLPQPYITQVGEHMLALVQALDPFASSADSLAIAKEVMGGVRDVALQPWKDLVAAAGISNDSIAETLMKGIELNDYVNSVFEDDDEIDKGQDESDKDKHDFSNQWLDVVGLAVTGRLLERILRIPRLTPKGCEHLSADLNYLINVLAALGVSGHPHPLVNHFSEISALDADSLKAMIGGRERSIPLVNALCTMEERLALMRGVSKN